MRTSLFLMLALIIPVPASADTVQIVARYHGVSGAPAAPVTVSGVARLRTAEARNPPVADRQLELSAPGRETLDLERGTWFFELSREGFWCEPKSVHIAEGENRVDFDLWPTGTLKARILPPKGEESPDRLAVHFASVPSKDDGKKSPTGMISCPVQEESCCARFQPAGLICASALAAS